MIPIYIGISESFRFLEGMTERSILKHTNADVEIIHLYPEVESGCTGFSDVRFTIKKGIYLDVDMIVLGDIAELWEYRRDNKFVCMRDGSTAVAVIDCEHNCTNKKEHHLLPMEPIIPSEWNTEDRVENGMKLLHFTNMHTQPWFFDHPNKEALEIYDQYK